MSLVFLTLLPARHTITPSLDCLMNSCWSTCENYLFDQGNYVMIHLRVILGKLRDKLFDFNKAIMALGGNYLSKTPLTEKCEMGKSENN